MTSSNQSPFTGKWLPLQAPEPQHSAPEIEAPETTHPAVRYEPIAPIMRLDQSEQERKPENEPPLFRRSPRNYIPAPKEEIEIKAPPAAEGKPTSSLITLLLPAILSTTGIVLSVFLISSGNWSYLAISLPMMLGSAAVGVISYFGERKNYRKRVEQRKASYQRYLQETRDRLESLVRRQGEAALSANPPLSECARRATARDRRLWERSPHAPDYLSIRLGTGTLPASFRVRAPDRPQALETDPLLEDAIRLGTTYQTVDSLPVQLSLVETGVAGFAGPRADLIALARTFLVQLSTHHAPDEVKVILLLPEAEADQWDWARWLPHAMWDEHRDRLIRCSPQGAHQILIEFSRSLQERKSLLESQRGTGVPAGTIIPALVFLFADFSLWSGIDAVGGTMIHQLITEGPALGAYSIFLAESSDRLIQACCAVVEVGPRRGMLKFMGSQPTMYGFKPDSISLEDAGTFARAMAPLRLQRLATASAQDLPKMVSILDVLGARRVEDLHLVENWAKYHPENSMAAPVGVLASGDVFELNMQDASRGGHGSHGLVAGGTGSGKTEFLQALVLSMAARFHPHEVVFAFLDFKGGDMIAPLRKLPHVVSEITNLDLEEVPRALISLEAEINRREKIFDDLRKRNQVEIRGLEDYMALRRAGKVTLDLPFLIIIVDEFTVLKQARSEDMDRFITIAVKGRSAGVRMILATQNPTGVVSGQVDANTRLRVCLRVNQKEHSTDILKRPDAASLKNAGNAYIKVGEGDLFQLIQAAYTGSPYDPDLDRNIYLGPDMHWIDLCGKRTPLNDSARAVSHKGRPSQIQAIVDHIARTAEQEVIHPLQGPWLEPLPHWLSLADVQRSGTIPANGSGGKAVQPLRPCIGLYDDPLRQEQGPLVLDFSQNGHLAVIGAPSTGKTTLLQTLVSALTQDHSPDAVHLYFLDFGGRSLKLFENLPHTGAIVLPEESERIDRLISLFLEEMETRKRTIGQFGLTSLAGYRVQNPGEAIPDLFLFIDNLPAFQTLYPEQVEQLAGIAGEGGKLGIHLVVSANTFLQVPVKLSSNIAMIVCLELNDPAEYSITVGQTDGMAPKHGVRGSGLFKAAPLPLLFQTALPAEGNNEQEVSQCLRALVQTRQAAWSGKCTRAVPVLRECIGLSELITPEHPGVKESMAGCPVPLGREITCPDLAPFQISLNDGPHFIITGAVQSGKTTLLQTWLVALAHRYSVEQVQFYIVSYGDLVLASLQKLPHTQAFIEEEDALRCCLEAIEQELNRRKAELGAARRVADGPVDDSKIAARWPALVLAMDDFDQFQRSAGDDQKALLAKLLKRRGSGFHAMIAGPVSEFSSGWGDLATALKELQSGFLLGTSEPDHLGVFNIKLPFGEAGKAVPTGRAFCARKGRYRVAQMATCLQDTLSMSEWLKIIMEQSQEG